MGDWKAVKSNLEKNPTALWELYNIKTDRNETNNMAAQHQELLKQFNSILKKEHRPAPVKEWEFIGAKSEQ